jgi:hypothetical protein
MEREQCYDGLMSGAWYSKGGYDTNFKVSFETPYSRFWSSESNLDDALAALVRKFAQTTKHLNNSEIDMLGRL